MVKKIAAKSAAQSIAAFLPVIVAVTALAYAALAYVLVFMPKIGRFLDGGALDLAPYEQVLGVERGYVGRLEDRLAEAQGVTAVQRAKIASLVPGDADVPGLLVALEALATRNNVVLVSVDATSGEEEESGGRKAVRLAVNLAGVGYAQLRSVLADLARSQRIIDVQGLTYSPGNGSVSLTAKAYFRSGAAPTGESATVINEEMIP
jgi:hypothetical protein